ncbi:MAG: hypothetical protein JXA11_09605 [Phycisphaerae bacterium]|nr:hypothetical protein [Phycisphaerae bacterium]
MFLFTFPVLLMLLLSERRLLPKRLGDVLDAGILTITDTKAFSEFLKTWGKKYGVVNIIGQLLGLTAGVLASLGNYQYLTSEHPWTWQLTEGSVNVSGWLFLILLIPLFFFIAVFYLIRGFATIAFLHSLVKTPGIQVKLEPFHPDNSGGLSPIGGIGLRNQLVLATGGIQVVMLVLVAKNLNNPSPMLYILQVAGAALYLVGAPLMFIGPLLPFRKVMLNGKRQLLKTIGDIMQKLIEGIENQNTIADLSKDVQAVEELRSLVRKVPVWPFDAITLRRFIVLYVLPVVTIIATSFAHELPGLVKSIFRF